MLTEAVKPGYKQTEVGLIPEDWVIKLIGKISKVVRGGSPRPAGDPKYFKGNFIPWLTVAALTNIPESQVYVHKTEDCLTKEGSKLSRTLLKNTLIISNSGATLGVTKILNINCCANDGIAALLEIENYILPLYLYYYLNSITKELREVVATGNGQPNLNTTLIGAIRVPTPSTKEEQIAIINTLFDADLLIESLERLIQKKKNIKQGAMQELLTGKGRLAGFRGEWETKHFGSLIELHKGEQLNSTSEGGY